MSVWRLFFSLIHETHLPFTDIFFKNPSEKIWHSTKMCYNHVPKQKPWLICLNLTNCVSYFFQGKLKIVGKNFKSVGFLEKYNCIVAFQCLCKFNFRLVWPAGLSAFCALYDGLAFFKFSILTRKTQVFKNMKLKKQFYPSVWGEGISCFLAVLQTTNCFCHWK